MWNPNPTHRDIVVFLDEMFNIGEHHRISPDLLTPFRDEHGRMPLMEAIVCANQPTGLPVETMKSAPRKCVKTNNRHSQLEKLLEDLMQDWCDPNYALEA